MFETSLAVKWTGKMLGFQGASASHTCLSKVLVGLCAKPAQIKSAVQEWSVETAGGPTVAEMGQRDKSSLQLRCIDIFHEVSFFSPGIVNSDLFSFFYLPQRSIKSYNGQ